jgi:hypothetical protein
MKIIFIHCPKTGGRSISKMIGGSNSKNKNENVQDGHFTLNHYAENHNLDNFFVFTITRNPWDRIVSCYHYAKSWLNTQKEKAKKLNQKFEPSTLHGALWLKLKNNTFEEYVNDFYETYKSPNVIYILPSVKLKPQPGLSNIIDCIKINNQIKANFILNLHTLNQDWKTLSDLINVRSEIHHVNKSNHEDYRLYYKNNALIEIVEEIYKPDIDYFGFKFEDKNYSNFSRIIKQKNKLCIL